MVNKQLPPEGDVVRGDEEVDQPLHYEGGRSLSWVHPGHDEHHLDSPPLEPLLVVRGDGDHLLLAGQVVRGGDGNEVDTFIKNALPQSLLDDIVVLLTQKFLHTKLEHETFKVHRKPRAVFCYQLNVGF